VVQPSENQPQPAPKKPELLSAEEVFQLASLQLRARTVAEGVFVGAHTSRRFGASTDFAEHKVYVPGDDVRHLDWKVLARKDRLYVRRFWEESGLDVHLVVDASASMAYAGGAKGAFGVSKMRYATTLAAALAWIAGTRGDPFSLALFSGEERGFLPLRARRDHLHAAMSLLELATPQGETRAVEALQAVQERITRRSLLVVISDLLDVGESILGPLGVLRKRGADVLLLQVLDRDELEFPFEGVVRFEDLEGDRLAQVDAPGVRKSYLAELNQFLEGIRDGAARRDLRHHVIATDVSPTLALRHALGLTASPLGRQP
jgi:uncharacterized protein (DUF58 family)